MSIIHNKTHQIPTSLVKPTVAKTPITTNKEQTHSTETSTPTESFTATSQPVADIKKQDSIEKPKLKKPREGSAMAQMLEDVERAEERSEDYRTSANGTLVQLEDPTFGSLKDVQIENAILADAYKKAQANIEADKKADGHEGGHGHSNDAMLGGHLGTEVVEKVGHSAHHGASHVTDAAGHAVTEAKGHAATHVAHQVKSEVAHGIAKTAGHVKAESTSLVAETATDLAQVGQAGHAKLAGEVSEAVKHGADAAHHLSTGLSTALATSAAASGGLGAVMLYKGGKELAHGVKEKDGEKIAEGVGGLAVGTRSVAAATVMTSMVSSSSTVAQVASVASKTLTPLGVVHGAIDVGLGVKDLVKGKTTEGLLKVGFGTSVIAGAVVGGIPLTVVAMGFLGAKVGHAVVKGREAKKAAKEAEAQQQPVQQQLPDPAVYSDPYAALKDTQT